MNDVSAGPLSFFTQDHRACDQLWAAVEAAVSSGDNAAAQAAWESFERAMRRHFQMEEEVLFPAFEDATGMRQGPTQVMRMEHTQMRGVLDQMAAEASKGDYELMADHGDTLLMLIQQHNVKEENILYPMADQHLASHWGNLSPKVEAIYGAKG